MSDLRMPDLNKVFLAGRLTRDPELRYLATGTAVCKMGLAVSRFYKTKEGEKREETLFINVTAWGKSGEYCNEHLRKGRPILVEGQLRSNDYTDKEGQKRTGFEVSTDRVHFLDWEDRGGSPASRPQPREIEEPMPEAEDDIPF